MRKLPVVAVLAGCCLLPGLSQSASADSTTGFLIPDAWMDDGLGDWTFNFPWFLDLGTATFKTSANNAPGFYAAEASPRDLTAEANVLALSNYDPSTTALTGLTFHDPWRHHHYGTVPTDGDYNYYIELTIDTTAGFYRASSQKLNNPFVNSPAQLGFVFNWEGGGFLGDPFAGSGIPLAQINGMTYNVFMEVISPTSGGDGWFGAEGFNVEYEVTSIPEPASAALMGLGFLAMARRSPRIWDR